jgi:hypothetical protein
MIELSEIKENVSWDQAMNYAKGLGEGWRLPELWKLVLMHRAKELGHPLFQDMNGGFWSSTTFGDSSNCVWYVSFYYGSPSYGNKFYSLNVMYVRASKGAWAELTAWIEEQEDGKNART